MTTNDYNLHMFEAHLVNLMLDDLRRFGRIVVSTCDRRPGGEVWYQTEWGRNNTAVALLNTLVKRGKAELVNDPDFVYYRPAS